MFKKIITITVLLIWGSISISLAGDFQDNLAGGFQDNLDSTVTDNKTGLMWQKKTADNFDEIIGDVIDEYNEVIWEHALLYCVNLGLGGHHDWRLPNYKELRSIVNFYTNNPAIYKIFSNTKNTFYWSSTSTNLDGSQALCVKFTSGAMDSLEKVDYNCVRCVRGGIQEVVVEEEEEEEESN